MFTWPPQEAVRKPAKRGAKENDPSPGSAPGPAQTSKARGAQWEGGRQLGCPTVSATAAFLKRPQGTKTSGRGMSCVCVYVWSRAQA